MKTVEKISDNRPVVPKKKRVAAYARVSVESERMRHSLSAQVSYYSSLIQSNPEWEYAGVFADYGISGTGTKARTEFNRMLWECEKGNIDIILTKSIQRFARNTVDLLNTVRRLKAIGIEVRFEKEQINSMSGEGELMLSILASFAQEESRSISENSKWGIRKRFKSGEIGAANKHLLGYRYDEEKRQYVIIPEEAEIVRKMFALYLDGVSLKDICAELNGAGYRTINGCLFQEASLHKMIKNEVYAGDILRQKCHIPDPISKKKEIRGSFPCIIRPMRTRQSSTGKPMRECKPRSGAENRLSLRTIRSRAKSPAGYAALILQGKRVCTRANALSGGYAAPKRKSAEPAQASISSKNSLRPLRHPFSATTHLTRNNLKGRSKP